MKQGNPPLKGRQPRPSPLPNTAAAAAATAAAPPHVCSLSEGGSAKWWRTRAINAQRELTATSGQLAATMEQVVRLEEENARLEDENASLRTRTGGAGAAADSTVGQAQCKWWLPALHFCSQRGSCALRDCPKLDLPASHRGAHR